MFMNIWKQFSYDIDIILFIKLLHMPIAYITKLHFYKNIYYVRIYAVKCFPSVNTRDLT